MRGLLLLVFLGISFGALSQAKPPVESYAPENFPEATLQQLRMEFGNHKEIPIEFERQILIALSHFPELKCVSIKFRIKTTRTPLTSRPELSSLITPGSSRTYVITISKQSQPMFDSILLKNLSFNSQVGVIGHELSHISFYQKRSFFQLVSIAVQMTSSNWVDRFENNTDKTCIEHGLGFQLLSWSSEVRQRLQVKQWLGSDSAPDPSVIHRERYMSPESIRKYMSSLEMYK